MTTPNWWLYWCVGLPVAVLVRNWFEGVSAAQGWFVLFAWWFSWSGILVACKQLWEAYHD